MVSAAIGVGLALLALLGLTMLEIWAWWQNVPEINRWRGQMAYLSLGLLLLSLVWLGVERRHIPPIGFDEILLLLSALMQALYLKLKTIIRAPNSFVGAGLLLATIGLAMGLIVSLTGTPSTGLEPLWIWALPARWSLLAGVAGLNWLAVSASLAWWGEATTSASWQARLGLGRAEMSRLSQQLRPAVTLAVLSGSCLAITRNLWGWGDQARQSLLLIVLILLLLAGWWLRFTRPHRKLWSLAILLLAFITTWPALAAIAG